MLAMQNLIKPSQMGGITLIIALMLMNVSPHTMQVKVSKIVATARVRIMSGYYCINILLVKRSH